MADEVQYASGGDAGIPTNKRKYDDQTPPPSSGTRRPTGFSAPITSSSPPDPGNAASLSNVELAKQKAQEIAARIFESVDPSKRSRTDNGGGGGYDSGSTPEPKSIFSATPVGSNPSTIPVSYGFQGTKKMINIPNGRVGVIIGKAGETIKFLQLQSGAKIQVTRDVDADLSSEFRLVELMGSSDQIEKAEGLIKEVLSEAEAGGSNVVSKRFNGPSGSEQFVMKIPNNKVGLIIGKGGETIKNMQSRSGARIQVIPLHLPPGDTSTERTLQIDGSSSQIESAKQLVDEVISENRLRGSAMSGGYTQQGYQARPQTNWGSPAPPPMQQSGYGYVQPGAYPGPTPPYMSQPPYPGYPQQQSGGYSSSGWDQGTVPPNQQTTPGTGYDYYSQQAPQQQQGQNGQAPVDNSSYNYNQQATYPQGQGYTQESYAGGYHAPAPQAGYGQPNSVPGYDQQQGYNSASGYGNMTNPTQDATSYGTQGETTQPAATQPPAMGQQGYSTSQQPSPNTGGYPSQGAAQPGYGMPPTSQPGYGTQPPAQPGYAPGYGQPQAQKPPGSQPPYGQAQQSPSAQGAYAQTAPVQPGYPPSQPPPAQTAYAQPDPAAPRAPPSGYTTPAQPGYGAPAYSGAPVSQQQYGQQPSYNGTSYAGGYSQPPVYSADGNAAPASQAVQSSAAKASPES